MDLKQVTGFADESNIDKPLSRGNALVSHARSFSAFCASRSRLASIFRNSLCEIGFLPTWLGRLIEVYGVLPGRLAGGSPIRLAYAAIAIDGGSHCGGSPERFVGAPLPANPQFARVRDFCMQSRTPHEATQVEQIAGQLRSLRASLGFSRLELARQLEIDLEMLVAIENGYGNLETVKPLLDRLIKIQAARPAL